MIVVGAMNWKKVPYNPTELSDRPRVDARESLIKRSYGSDAQSHWTRDSSEA